MQPDKLVSKLIDLQEKADAHTSEYTRLQSIPGRKTRAISHQKKALKLRSRIQEIIRAIAQTSVTYNVHIPQD